MSGRRRETRTKTKEDTERRAAIKQTMANEETPGWAKNLLSEVVNLKDSFERRLDDLDNSMKDLRKETRDILNRVTDAEKRIGDLEDQSAADSKALKNLTKEMNLMKAKFTNLEAHSKRNNLVFVGLDEELEPGNLDKKLNDILRYILDLKEDDPVPEVERHHRTLRPRPAPTEPPRPYLVRMLRWTDRQRTLRAAAKKGQLFWGGKPFRVYQDLPVEIKRQRAEFDDIRGKLRNTDLRYGLLYPARLIVTIDAVKHTYNNASEAAEDLRRRLPKVFG